MYEFYTVVVDGYLCSYSRNGPESPQGMALATMGRIRLRGYPPPGVAPAAFNVKTNINVLKIGLTSSSADSIRDHVE